MRVCHLRLRSSLSLSQITSFSEQNIISLLPPATKLRQGYIFTGVCDSVHRGRYLGGAPPGTRYTPQAGTPPASTPPWDQVHPQDQVHSPGRYTTWDQVHPADQVYPADQVPPGRYTPWDQVHPARPGTPPWGGTPWAGTPPGSSAC